MNRWTAAAVTSSLLAIGLAIRVAAQGRGEPPAVVAPVAEAPVVEADVLCATLREQDDVRALADALGPKRLPAVRRCAAERLADLESDAATERLRALADDPDPDVLSAALRGLARRTDPSARAFVAARAQSSVAALVAMAEAHAPDAPDRIVEALSHTRRARDRLRLVAALGETGDEGAVPALSELAADPDSRSAAIQAIGRIGGPRARPILDRLLEEAPDGELATILAGLARYPDGRDQLAARLSSRRPAMREAASGLLRAMDTPEVRALMLRELDDTDPERVGTALAYFADSIEPTAIARLSQLARDARPSVAGPATAALVAQGPAAHGELATLLRANREAAGRVLEAARDTPALRPALRAAALRRLSEGSIRGGPVLDYLAGDLSREALDALVGAARTAHQAMPVLEAIASRGDAAALDALGSLARDGRDDLARDATRTLAACADARARTWLLRATRSGDASIRRQAIGTLLRIGAPEGLQADTAAIRVLAGGR